MTVIDALDAGGNGLPDRGWRICVYGHVGAPIAGSLNRGADLGFGILRRFDRIVRGRDTTAGHQLDLTRTLSELLARSQPDLVGAVSDGCNALNLGVAQVTAQCP